MTPPYPHRQQAAKCMPVLSPPPLSPVGGFTTVIFIPRESSSAHDSPISFRVPKQVVLHNIGRCLSGIINRAVHTRRLLLNRFPFYAALRLIRQHATHLCEQHIPDNVQLIERCTSFVARPRNPVRVIYFMPSIAAP